MNRPEGVGATAVFVAAGRAFESERDDHLFDDQWAGRFVRSAGWVPSTEAMDDTSREMLTTWMAVRTKFLDDYVLAAVAGGCGQVVLLGAGLDSRAFRLPWPKPVTVYELDTSEMVAFKSAVLGAATPGAATRIVVPIDLRDDWPAALTDAGFLPDVPTAWILEGLLLYLPEDAVDGLIRRVGDLSAPGSEIGATVTNVDVEAVRNDPNAFQHGLLGREEWLDLLNWNGPDDPEIWLGGYGWDATAVPTDDLTRRYGRTLSTEAMQRPARPGDRWMVSAVRRREA
ncbi:SAM-dependent methyltransferase [Prescottella subtropica]|uniref:SAM-dependent methyltransferase n=1 Tax=Prescottella subtropica TaxID=2545757 RepID=UPI00138748D8|nr:SAM-dependent methyltransferase [Prescottella subtropica]